MSAQDHVDDITAKIDAGTVTPNNSSGITDFIELIALLPS
jgi:hypothetical protein